MHVPCSATPSIPLAALMPPRPRSLKRAQLATPVKAAPVLEAAPSRKAQRQALLAMEDLELLNTVLEGRRYAFEIFYARFRSLICACATRVCQRAGRKPQNADIAEILSEVSLNMVASDYRRLRLYRPDAGCSVSSWVGVIASSTTHDYLRKLRRHRLEPTQDQDLERVIPPVDGPDVALFQQQQRNFVNGALKSFSARDQRFFELYYVEALAPEDIAKEMGVSVATIYSKKAKIKTRLRAMAEAA